MRPGGLSSEEELDGEQFYFSISKPLREEDENAGDWVTLQDVKMVDPRNIADKKEAFHKAAELSDIEYMAVLMENGISVDESSGVEWTPLMKACSRGDYEVVEFLLKNGADPNVEKDLFTPLMACCICSYVQEEGRLICVKKLIEKTVNVNARDKFGATSLMTASASGLDSIVAELLLVPTIEINVQDRDGWNALFFAVNGNYKSIASRLVTAGIDLSAVNSKGLTVYQLATLRGYGEILDILMSRDEEEQLVVRELAEPITDFLLQMPDLNGEGGFCSDVRDLFTGLGMEKLYDKCNIRVSLHDFLLMGEELEKLGIKLGPLKRKIRIQGIHRYHIYPWKKSSLHSFERESDFSFEIAINCLANVTKHLSVMCATLKYLKMRIPHTVTHNRAIIKEVITTLVNAYIEVDNLYKNLMAIIEISKKIDPIGEKEVDLVVAKKKPRRCNYFALLAGSIVALLYYKRFRT